MDLRTARLEENTALAYQVAVFSRTKKLKGLRAYLGRVRRNKPLPEPTPEEREQIVAAAEKWAAELNGGKL